jgi:hypothetical protein
MGAVLMLMTVVVGFFALDEVRVSYSLRPDLQTLPRHNSADPNL